MSNPLSAMLDELMGKHRNANADEEKKETTWEDPEVCPYYLSGYCPHEMFTNTKADLGPCYRIHDEKLKEQYVNSPRFENAGLEDEFLSFLQRTQSDMQRKIDRNKQRLELTQPGGQVGDADKDKIVEKICHLTEKINALLSQAEQLGEKGQVEEAQGVVKMMEDLKEERDRLQQNLNSESNDLRTMEVCDICGCFLVVNDAQHRLDEHYLGKQHLGFAKIRATVDELMRRKQERREKREKELKALREKEDEERRNRRSDRSTTTKATTTSRRRSRSRDDARKSRGSGGRKSRSRSRDRRKNGDDSRRRQSTTSSSSRRRRSASRDTDRKENKDKHRRHDDDREKDKKSTSSSSKSDHKSHHHHHSSSSSRRDRESSRKEDKDRKKDDHDKSSRDKRKNDDHDDKESSRKRKRDEEEKDEKGNQKETEGGESGSESADKTGETSLRESEHQTTESHSEIEEKVDSIDQTTDSVCTPPHCDDNLQVNGCSNGQSITITEPQNDEKSPAIED